MNTQEIKETIDKRLPVMYEGKRYLCITAYIYRMIRDPYNGMYHTIVQVELLDQNRNSVIIADPRKVSVAEKEESRPT